MAASDSAFLEATERLRIDDVAAVVCRDLPRVAADVGACLYVQGGWESRWQPLGAAGASAPSYGAPLGWVG